MFHATILRIDDSVVASNVEVDAQKAKRGTGDGRIWRGVFSVHSMTLRPTVGEAITVCVHDELLIPAVVTELAGARVHFRAQGHPPMAEPETAKAAAAQSA